MPAKVVLCPATHLILNPHFPSHHPSQISTFLLTQLCSLILFYLVIIDTCVYRYKYINTAY